MGNISSVVAIVKSRLNKYDTFGIIDEDMLFRDAELALRGFGNPVTLIHEDVIPIKKGVGNLPNNFFKLLEVRLCYPLNYERSDKRKPLYNVVDTQFINLIHELETKWDECEDCCKEKNMKVYRKEIIMKDDFSVTCNYNKGLKVKLKDTVIKNYCDKAYGDFTPECDTEISIRGNTINASFSEGDLYIKYNGFPVDEDGYVDFDDSPNRLLETYIEDLLMQKAVLRLIESGVSGLANMLPYYDQKASVSKIKARNEVRMNKININRLSNKLTVQNTEFYQKNTAR